MVGNTCLGPTCSQCGARLQVEWTGIEPKPTDRMTCLVHGDVGSRAEVKHHITEALVLAEERNRLLQLIESG